MANGLHMPTTFPLGQLRKQHVDLQRVAGQGEAKAQQNPQPQAPPTAPGGAEGAPVGFGVRFRIALASRALPVHAGRGACQLLFPAGRCQLLVTDYTLHRPRLPSALAQGCPTNLAMGDRYIPRDLTGTDPVTPTYLYFNAVVGGLRLRQERRIGKR